MGSSRTSRLCPLNFRYVSHTFDKTDFLNFRRSTWKRNKSVLWKIITLLRKISFEGVFLYCSIVIQWFRIRTLCYFGISKMYYVKSFKVLIWTFIMGKMLDTLQDRRKWEMLGNANFILLFWLFYPFQKHSFVVPSGAKVGKYAIGRLLFILPRYS